MIEAAGPLPIRAAASAGGIAIAHGGTGDIRVARGLAIDLDAFEAFARRHDIQQRALDGFTRTVLERKVPLEETEATLTELAALHLRTRAELQELRPHGDAVSLRAQAAEALEEGRIEDADALLQRVADLAADNARAAQIAAMEAQREQARTAALQGNLRLMKLDYAGAAAAYRAALALLPAGDGMAASYLVEIAGAERRAGRFDRAVAAVDQALAAVPAAPDAVRALCWQERARALRDAGRYAEAMEALDQAQPLMQGAGTAEALTEARIDAAGLLVDLDRLDEAARALAGLSQDAARPGELSRAARRMLARSIHTLGRLRLEEGRWA